LFSGTMLEALVDALNQRTTQEYYATGLLKATIDPLGNRTTYNYDAAGNQVSVQDALGRLTTTVYDEAGRVAAMVDARGYRTTYIYDGAGRRTALEDARSNRTTFVYDDAGRLTALIDQLAQRTTYGYDAAGRHSWRLDAKNQRTTYSYDDAGRQTSIQYSDGGRVTYSYDAVGNRIRMEDSTGITTHTYDELGRSKTVTYPAGKTITYSYDAVGNRAALNDPDGGITTYSYDSRNLLAGLVNPFGERTTWVYDALRRVTTMTHGNGSLAQHDYDAAGRLTALRNLKSDASVISIFTYSYDSVGNGSGAAEANGDRVTWSYDPTYQLTREQRSGANSYDITYSYDPVGNRLIKIEGGAAATYTYDAANQLNTSEDSSGVTTYTYDANGNTVGEIRPNADRVTYTWDIENRLAKVELPSSTVNTMTYDGEGKRRRMEDSAGLRNFLWDLENILLETDQNNATAAVYTMEPLDFGNLVSKRIVSGSLFYHFDSSGSIGELTDSNESITDSYLYKAFGICNVLTGNGLNPARYVGQLGYYWDFDSDLLQLRARYYLTRFGRFISRVPISVAIDIRISDWEAMPVLPLPGIAPQLVTRILSSAAIPEHPYGYCGNDPVNWVDPAGYFKWQALLMACIRRLRPFPWWAYMGACGALVPALTLLAKGLYDLGRRSLPQSDIAAMIGACMAYPGYDLDAGGPPVVINAPGIGEIRCKIDCKGQYWVWDPMSGGWRTAAQ
jgi:YD repeat-containing protein